ncbi:MAG: ribonuclease D [Hyphomicrobiales bacterium]|nr:ribonuclease D [Hyphomicrobiales bacterium]
MKPITSTQELAAAVRALAAHDVVTVDTEFMRETTFWPKLCLIQMAASGITVLIDPLAEKLDLKPFFELMANEKVLKVFHAARQDLEIIHHLAGVIPHPIFDTQAAAMVCGYGDSVSYEALVKKTAGAEIDKSHRFTDWSRRPLSDKQLSYALADVTHLLDVHEVLAAKLAENRRADWLREEMEILTAPATYAQRPEDAWKRLKVKLRKSRQLAVLIEAAAWREAEAQRRDQPRGRILKDEAIHEIANHAPTTEEELAQLRMISRGFARSEMARGLVAAVKRGLKRDLKSLPAIDRREAPRAGVGPIGDLLKVLLKMICDEQGVAQRIVATADELHLLAADDKADVPALKGWRRELFGAAALKLKRGETALAIEGDRVAIVERAKG